MHPVHTSATGRVQHELLIHPEHLNSLPFFSQLMLIDTYDYPLINKV
jgi:hypothetical protein